MMLAAGPYALPFIAEAMEQQADGEARDQAETGAVVGNQPHRGRGEGQDEPSAVVGKDEARD